MKELSSALLHPSGGCVVIDSPLKKTHEFRQIVSLQSGKYDHCGSVKLSIIIPIVESALSIHMLLILVYLCICLYV